MIIIPIIQQLIDFILFIFLISFYKKFLHYINHHLQLIFIIFILLIFIFLIIVYEFFYLFHQVIEYNL